MNQQNTLLVVLVAAALLAGAWFFYSHNQPSESPPAGDTPAGTSSPTEGGSPGEAKEPPSVSETAAPTESQNPIVVVETSLGTFKVQLYLDKAPITAGNFLRLVEQGFYDGLVFHRVVRGFVVQGGDPFCVSQDEQERARCGQGGPGWTIPLEVVPGLVHDAAGVVAMARSQDPNSAGSQFYVTLDALPSLDGKYAVFGRVVEGLDVVQKIGDVPVQGPSNRPLEDVVMQRVYRQE